MPRDIELNAKRGQTELNVNIVEGKICSMYPIEVE